MKFDGPVDGFGGMMVDESNELAVCSVTAMSMRLAVKSGEFLVFIFTSFELLQSSTSGKRTDTRSLSGLQISKRSLRLTKRKQT